MLRYVEKQLKGKMDYRIVRWIMFALKCCFWLLEKILKFISEFLRVAFPPPLPQVELTPIDRQQTRTPTS